MRRLGSTTSLYIRNQGTINYILGEDINIKNRGLLMLGRDLPRPGLGPLQRSRDEWTATCGSDNCKIALQKFMIKACVLLMNKTIFKVQLF
jgi:hypothetical protein